MKSSTTLNDPNKIVLQELEEILLYFSTSTIGKYSEEEILSDLVRNCVARMGFAECVVYMLSPITNQLDQKAIYNSKKQSNTSNDRPLQISLGQGIIGNAALHFSSKLINGESLKDKNPKDKNTSCSEIAVPIIYKDKLLGVIGAKHLDKDFFDTHHLKILSSIAVLSANKLMNAKLEKAASDAEKHLLFAQVEMADIKLQSLKKQMNPHFMFNSLNAIQHFITTNDQWRALTYLSKFSKLMRLILENTESDKLYLSDEIKILHLYLALETMRFDEKFDYEISITSDTDIKSIKIPFLLIQPFVDKAINRGLVNKPDKGHLQILFFRNKKYLTCVVEDNGIGRRKAKEIKVAKRLDYASDSLIEKGIEWMNLQGNLKTKLTIKDLYNSENKPAGTRVELAIPIEDV